MTGEPDWAEATADERAAGAVVVVRADLLLTLDDVRHWVAEMEAAGADGLAAVWGLTGPPAHPAFPGGLAPQRALGGWPRGGYGPVGDMPGQRERTPIDDDPPPGTVGGREAGSPG